MLKKSEVSKREVSKHNWHRKVLPWSKYIRKYVTSKLIHPLQPAMYIWNWHWITLASIFSVVSGRYGAVININWGFECFMPWLLNVNLLSVDMVSLHDRIKLLAVQLAKYFLDVKFVFRFCKQLYFISLHEV